MTIENFYKRFLKENGLYFYGVKMSKNFMIGHKKLGFNKIPKKGLLYMVSSGGISSKEGILNLFKIHFQYERMFCGNSNSPKRRKFYKFNRKWKDSLRGKVVLQHNIMPGDILTYTTLYGDEREYLVKSINPNDTTIVVSYINGGKVQALYNNFINVICFDGIKSDKKDLIVNLYIKNEDGTCYGKIDGDFNEIQL